MSLMVDLFGESKSVSVTDRPRLNLQPRNNKKCAEDTDVGRGVEVYQHTRTQAREGAESYLGVDLQARKRKAGSGA